MKISEKSILPFASSVSSKIKAHSVDDSEFRVHYLDDMVLLFKKDDNNSFYGATIKILGRRFHITTDLTVMIDDEDKNTLYILEDMRILKFLEDFINIRTKLLKALGA